MISDKKCINYLHYLPSKTGVSGKAGSQVSASSPLPLGSSRKLDFSLSCSSLTVQSAVSLKHLHYEFDHSKESPTFLPQRF